MLASSLPGKWPLVLPFCYGYCVGGVHSLVPIPYHAIPSRNDLGPVQFSSVLGQIAHFQSFSSVVYDQLDLRISLQGLGHPSNRLA